MKIVRLTTNFELDHDDVELFYNIVDDVTEVIYVGATDDDGDTISDEVVVMVLECDDEWCYEIRVDHETNRSDGDEIARLLDEETEFDFELELVDI